MADAVSEFFAMGGHAGFIWPAYIIAVIILLSLIIFTLRDLWRNEKELKMLRANRRGETVDLDE